MNINEDSNIDIYEQLGKRIAFLRREKKMSQLDLALEAEINKNYLSDLERGRRNPTLLILNKLCIALGCNLSFLLLGIKDVSLEEIQSSLSKTK